jgi:DnaJ-class molecular chaperone
MTYSALMDERIFQRSVSADLNTIVRFQRERERREVCWVCMGTGRDMVGAICVYCGGNGQVHVEKRT